MGPGARSIVSACAAYGSSVPSADSVGALGRPTMADDYHGHGTVFFWVLVLAVVPATPFWIIMLFSSLTRLPLRQRVFHIATYFASWALFALYCRIDPWRYIEWYLD